MKHRFHRWVYHGHLVSEERQCTVCHNWQWYQYEGRTGLGSWTWGRK